MTTTILWKILTPDQWRGFEATAVLAGSPVDQADGFIHFSTQQQLPGTLAKHYSDAGPLFLLRVDASRVGPNLRWENSRDNELFPHLYDVLSLDAVLSVDRIVQSDDAAQRHRFTRRKILYLHGWKSVVGSVKSTTLVNAGHEVIQPALDHDEFESALATAQQAYDEHRPELIVGSSRGGAVALNIAPVDVARVLICPAWKKWGHRNRTSPRTAILHSREDDVVAYEDSVELIRNSGLPPDVLITTGSDHRLADEASLERLCDVCQWLPDRRFLVRD